MLGRRFEGGVDLSGGEWQKIALARAYLRDAQLLILDEPTAALDARSELEVFERFAELTTGKMALLISHRFSTVRMADRIVVLEGGRLVEEGNHTQLMALGGRYAACLRCRRQAIVEFTDRLTPESTNSSTDTLQSSGQPLNTNPESHSTYDRRLSCGLYADKAAPWLACRTQAEGLRQLLAAASTRRPNHSTSFT